MKQRIITGVILGIVALLAIVFLPTMAFSLLLFLVAMIGLNEWSNLLKLESLPKKVYLGVGGITLLVVTLVLIAGAKSSGIDHATLARFVMGNPIVYGLLVIMAIFWLCMPFLLSIHSRKPLALLTNREFLFVASILSLAALVITLVTLQESLVLLFYLILLVVIADSSAYFVGRKFGKRKLAPTISPGKTIEGALGGLIIGVIFSLIAITAFTSGETPLFPTNGHQWVLTINFVSLSALVVIVSISGDLFESVVKRHAGMKDSGNILPGHGGVLDRIDALTAAAPLFFVGLKFI